MSKQYIKILTKDLVHRDYQWKFGLNSISVFNTEKKCTPNSFYICEIKDFFKWVSLYNNIAYVGYVTIPHNAKTIIMKEKIKTNKVILHEPLITILEFIDIAIKNNADIHANNDSALQWAADNGYLDIVECLIKYGANVNAENDDTIRYASRSGYADIVELLIKHGANIHARDDYSFRCAASNGYLDVVKCLIYHGADIHAKNDYALRWASENGHLDVVKYLINHGAVVNSDSIRLAYSNNYLQVVNYLIKHGSNTMYVYFWYLIAIIEHVIQDIFNYIIY
jgi:hypothetical protein